MLLESIKGAVESGFLVHLHAPTDGQLAIEILKRFNNKVVLHSISLPHANHGRKSIFDVAKLLWSNFCIFKRVFFAVRGNIIYVNGGRLFFLGAMLALTKVSMVIFHIHIAPRKIEFFIINLIEKLPRVRLLIVNSPYIEAIVSSALTRSTKIKLIENQLPFLFSTLDFRSDIFNNGLTVITPGVIRPEKGQDEIIKLAERFPEIVFHIVGRVGDGAESWVQQLISIAPLNVIFHPATADIVKFINDLGCNVCLIPSKWAEPFGLVAVEGMACSCITVTSNQGGLRSIGIRTGALGYERPEDLLKIFETLQSLDEYELARLARSQYLATKRHFGQQNFGRNLISEIIKQEAESLTAH